MILSYFQRRICDNSCYICKNFPLKNWHDLYKLIVLLRIFLSKYLNIPHILNLSQRCTSNPFILLINANKLQLCWCNFQIHNCYHYKCSSQFHSYQLNQTQFRKHLSQLLISFECSELRFQLKKFYYVEGISFILMLKWKITLFKLVQAFILNHPL